MDVKSSLLLNQHLKDIQEGNYDGGRDPTQPLRQKRKLSKDIQTATQIGHDILDYDVDMTLTPTMVKSSNLADVFHADGGCEPKKKSAASQNKMFSNRLEGTRNGKYVRKIGKVENVNLEHRLFEISSTESSRRFYQVRICTQPSCSCPDFNGYGSKVYCKHILFV